jgi:acetylornithine/N-succinyldiaminopimelate aminotransferase
MLGCIEKGLLINKLKPNAIRLIPPLIITKKDVDEAVSILQGVLARQAR